MEMKIGYARISTGDQTLDLQVDALKRAGCEHIFSDIASGASTDRPELEKATAKLRAGDTLVVWKLDRLGRSLRHLIEAIQSMKEGNIGFCSLQENLDTTTSAGMLFFHIFGALAEFERALIRERTNAGIAAARARGRKGGRPKAINADKIRTATELLRGGNIPVIEVCRIIGVSKGTLYRHVMPIVNKFVA